MKKLSKIFLIIVVATIGLSNTAIAQIAINNDGSAADGSAMLDVKSTNSGLLLPRLNTIQISGINNPAAGLMVFNTDSSGFYGFSGNNWISVWSYDTLADWYCGNPITDSRDVQTYTTIQIGTQCWMSENLNIGTRTDGANNQTNNGEIEKYCYNNEEDSCLIYGGLYQWDEMMQYVATGAGVQGVCPDGWHLPTDEEWKQMEMALGMSQSEANNTNWRGTDEGGKMKETGYAHWNFPNNGVTNSSGFTALPGGYRLSSNGSFHALGSSGNWWSSTQHSGADTWLRNLSYSSVMVRRSYYSKTTGYSVRCLKN